MPRPDRDVEWKDHVDSKTEASTRAREPELRALKRAGVSSENVTGDEHWDMFLSILQEKLEALTGTRDQAAELLLNSDVFDTAQLISQKLGVRLYGTQIEILEWVMGLPKHLMEQGDQSSKRLGTIDKKSD